MSEETWPDGTRRWIVSAVWGHLAAWQALGERLGWQVSVTNTPQAQSTAPALVASYHQQVLEARGCSRLKRRTLHLRPVSLRDETRIAGLLWLLCLALRGLTLTAYRRRIALAEHGEALAGLHPASRTQRTTPPTTERVLAACANRTLTTIRAAGDCDQYVTPLNATQRHVVAVLQLPSDLYERWAHPPTNLMLHLRE